MFDFAFDGDGKKTFIDARNTGDGLDSVHGFDFLRDRSSNGHHSKSAIPMAFIIALSSYSPWMRGRMPFCSNQLSSDRRSTVFLMGEVRDCIERIRVIFPCLFGEVLGSDKNHFRFT